jgi:hypothetical protein
LNLSGFGATVAVATTVPDPQHCCWLWLWLLTKSVVYVCEMMQISQSLNSASFLTTVFRETGGSFGEAKELLTE